MITFQNNPAPMRMDSKLDETESLVTSVEVSDDELPVRKVAIVKVGVLNTSQSSSERKLINPLLKR